MSDGMQVRPLLCDDASLLAKSLAHSDSRFESVHPVEHSAGVCDTTLLVHDREHGQTVPLADLKVVGVVRRGHLHRTSAELRVNVGVGDDRDLTTRQWEFDLGPDQEGVALVARMNRDSSIAEHGLDAGRRNNNRRIPVAVAH